MRVSGYRCMRFNECEGVCAGVYKIMRIEVHACVSVYVY